MAEVINTDICCVVQSTILTSYMQAALEMDIEDINAYLQRKDAVQLLKRMPKSRSKPTAAARLASDVSDSNTKFDGQQVGAGAAA